MISHQLIEEHGFTWIGIESDRPGCWRINRWVRGQGDPDLDAYQHALMVPARLLIQPVRRPGCA